MKKKIIVSIGLPIYNSNKKKFEEVIKSIVSQTHKNIELIISDNNSTESMLDIINKYKKKYKKRRILYFRQKKNIGGWKNFHFVLKKSKGKYFAWGADDDLISKDFVTKNLLFLESNLNYVGSISPAKFENYNFNHPSMGDQTIDDDNAINRSLKSISNLHANSRFRALLRRKTLIKYFDNNKMEFLANDYFLMFKMLFDGKFKRIKEGYIILGKKGTSSSLKNIMQITRNNYLSIFFAFNQLFVKVFIFLRKKKFKINFITKYYILFLMLRLNIKYVYVNLFKVNLYNLIHKFIK
jgi:glycosyltransferase involved in cell wall biosynthesis